MKLRTALLGVAGGVGATVAGNRLVRESEPLEQPLPGEAGTYRWRGMDVAYVEDGDPDDPDVLLLHGMNAAGTSKEFEPIWSQLAEDYHVIAPDFPGFGRSDRPPLQYSASLYESFVADFARDLTDDAVCLASSLSAAYAVDAAAADPDLFSRLVLVCPTSETMPGRKVWLRSALRAPLVGETVFNVVTSKPLIDYFAADHGYYDVERKSEGLAEYQHHSSHLPGARYAPASFVAGFLDSELDLGATLADLDLPTTLVWGRETEITPLRDGRDLAERADARLVVVDYAKLQPHAEHPDEFLDAVAEELPVARA